MRSEDLIKSLSKIGAEDLASSSQWINPIPDDGYALKDKIEMALNIVKFSQSRRAEEGGEVSSTHHLDSLIRLKTEVNNILLDKKQLK